MQLRTRTRLEGGEQVTIVFLGDSNTELTFHLEGHLNVAGLTEAGIFETYGANRAKVVNAGQCGDTADRARARLERDVLRFEPDLVFIGFGMNDAGNGPERIEESYLQPLREIVERIRAAGGEVVLRTTNPIVVCNTPPEGRPANGIPGRPWPGQPQEAYSAALVGLAAALDCPVVDHYTLWIKEAYPPTGGPNNPNSLWMRMSDAVHPNAAGHRAFYRELAPLLGLRRKLSWEY